MIKKWIVGGGVALGLATSVAFGIASHDFTAVQAHRADLTPTVDVTATPTMAMTSTSSTAQTMHFVLHEDGVKFVPLDKNKDAIGDLLVMEDSLYDAADQKVVGHVNGECIRTQLGKQYECSGTTELMDASGQISGQISWEGPFKDHEASSYFTVTGGTNIYDGAHGQFQVIASETKDAEAPKYKVTVSLL